MPSPINIITKGEWMARPPLNVEKLETPVDTVYIGYTGTRDKLTELQVLRELPSLQYYFIGERHIMDIPWNWMVDYNGNIYEGRGWRTNVEKEITSPLGYLNKKSIDIGLIGNFADKNPPRSMERVVTKLIEWGMTEKFIISTRHLKVLNWKDFPRKYENALNYLRGGNE